MIRTILRTLVEYLDPPRVIHDRSGVSPYLSRWYLFRSQRPTMPDGSSPFNELGNPKVGVILPNVNWSLYLHRFHRSDEDGELHSHPFEWSVALILAGGYREERRDNALGFPSVRARDIKPWTLNFIRHDTFHRVDLLEDDAWSLFLVGPKTKSWGFWDRVTGQYTEWREFLRRRQTPTIDEYCEDDVRAVAAVKREDPLIDSLIKTLDLLVSEVRDLPGMTPQERLMQRIDFAYGNLACSTNHKPTRAAFAKLAKDMGVTEKRFIEWAGTKEWWLPDLSVEPRAS